MQQPGAGLRARVQPAVDELAGHHARSRLLAHIAHERDERTLVLLEEATGNVPEPGLRLARPPAEQDPAVTVLD